MSKAIEIMTQITETQGHLREQEEAKHKLESQLAEIQKLVLADIQKLGELQDRLNKALSAANVDAALDQDCQDDG